jgi:hypothetical protein
MVLAISGVSRPVFQEPHPHPRPAPPTISSSHLQAGATIPFALQNWEQNTVIEIWDVTYAAQIPDALD